MNKIYICLFSFLFFYSNLFGQTSNEMTNAWGDIDYKDNAWVKNNSQPHHITKGLQNRHIAMWTSHGRFYDTKNKHGDGNVLVCLEPLKTCLLKL